VLDRIEQQRAADERSSSADSSTGQSPTADERALRLAGALHRAGNTGPGRGVHPTYWTQREAHVTTETAILAGGCFWGAQELLRKRPGVLSSRVGYSGGDTPNATYRDHGDHAEAVEIVFDPEVISFRELLEFFFQIHDPSTKDRQGNDVGRSYRSAIYYTSEEQQRVALDTIADVDASGLWPGKVVTEVTPAGPFWEAEEEHQDYLQKIPFGYTCHYVRPDWVLPRREAQTAR
jgi:peptide-methionine (S)-S-oxide reductase